MNIIRFYITGIYLLSKERKQNTKTAAGNAIYIFALHFIPLLVIVFSVTQNLFPEFKTWLQSNLNYTRFMIILGLGIFSLFVLSYDKLEAIIALEINKNTIKNWHKAIVYLTFPLLLALCGFIVYLTS